MSQYLSQNRIEEPVWLEPTEFSFLRKRISETEAQVESLEAQVFELRRQIDTKLGEIASFRNVLSPVRRSGGDPLRNLRAFTSSWGWRVSSVQIMPSYFTRTLFLVCVWLGERLLLRLPDFGLKSAFTIA